MKSNNRKHEFKNLVAVDGFHFSGSSILNDILKESGYVVPKDIRADEFLEIDNNLSWPKLINEGYTSSEKLKLVFRILKTILFRIPVNIIQKTPIYNHYLLFKGRADPFHQSTSVNRSIWSYIVSIYILSFKTNHAENLFIDWLELKYKWAITNNKNLLLDNGIPKHQAVAKLFFQIDKALGIFVYRDPRPQYQQILEVYKLTGKNIPSYEDFLEDLKMQYLSVSWFLNSKHKVLFISFDKFLNESEFRKIIIEYFQKEGVVQEISYDFTLSQRNNSKLMLLSKDNNPGIKEINLEAEIFQFHELFEKKLYDTVIK